MTRQAKPSEHPRGDTGAGMGKPGEPTHSFALVLSGDVEERLDELFEAGCSDATFGSVDGVWHADFDREAPTLEVAVASAIADVGKVEGVAVEGVAVEETSTGRGE